MSKPCLVHDGRPIRRTASVDSFLNDIYNLIVIAGYSLPILFLKNSNSFRSRVSLCELTLKSNVLLQLCLGLKDFELLSYQIYSLNANMDLL